MRDRLGEAVRVGAISEEYAARSLAQSEVTIARTPQRLGKAYLCVGHELFSSPEAQRGFDRLLGTWGGEGIYWDADSPIHIGRPTILVVDLAYDAIPDGFRASLTNALRARMLNAPESELSQVAEGYVTSDVPASAIVDIWQPGMAGYDRFDGLPGTPAAARREKERLTMKRQELSETIRLRRADSPT
ncbi:hypothetical protein [Microbacterium sp.]|uniref:hypothetical protein n=1 Tax=Microbacterium sp. TaxID=51671 RepID=UPI003C76B084